MRIRAALALLLAVPLLAVVAAPAAAAKPRGVDRLESIAFKRINDMRTNHGLRRLRRSRSLTRSASRYAGYMAGRGYFGHLSTIWAARRYRSLGEIILMHRGTHGRPRTAVRRWSGSPAHNSIMLSAKYRQIGVGKAYGWYGGRRVTMWVAHVGLR